MLRLCKLFCLSLIILSLLLTSGILTLFTADPDRLRRLQSKLLQFFSGLVLKVLGITSSSYSNPSFSENKNYLILANHLSYLDVLVLAHQFSGVFVTSVEVRDSGFLGWICQAAGCLFVERRKKVQVQEGINEISWQLSQGLNVILFPEATSSNGASVLPFRKSLLMAAVETGVEVLPVCLNYVSLDGVPVTTRERDQLFYYGEMKFLPHLWKVLAARSIQISVDRLSPVPVYANSCRKEIATHAFHAIASRYARIV